MPTYPEEQVHRIAYTKLTPEQILAKLSAVDGPKSFAVSLELNGGHSGLPPLLLRPL